MPKEPFDRIGFLSYAEQMERGRKNGSKYIHKARKKILVQRRLAAASRRVAK